MTRRLTDKQRAEMAMLRRRCEMFLDFLQTQGARKIEVAQYSEVLAQVDAERDLPSMRELWGEFKIWLRQFPEDVQAAFREQMGRDGENLVVERAREIDHIATLIERGVLDTEDEYRLVENRVNEIYADPKHKDELHALNNLLNTYSPPPS